MYTTRRRWFGITVLLLVLTALHTAAQDNLRQGFLQPPADAKPWVYWFWLNGNLTREGITADLEAMQRVGIGGVLIMEVDQGAPVGPVPFMSEQWRSLFRHAVAEAERLGLEVNMNNDAGWNGSGGPWIRPDQSMQEVVWTEVELAGPQQYDAVLPQPEAKEGFYRDIAVQAFPNVGEDRLPSFRDKAGYPRHGRPPAAPTTSGAPAAVPSDEVVDLTDRMAEDGRLTWDVPPGTWTVVRLGHTSTGMRNAPAPDSGRGLECDKLSRAGIEANFAGMMEILAQDTRSSPHSALAATHIDSWENDSQNWTPEMREQFRRLRGYDMTPYLPAMTGRVVENVSVTERFLWDLRKTISELVVENYSQRMWELAAQHGMRFTVEAYGSPCDALPYAGQSDEPMGEFWVGGGALETCRGMASAGHVYGKTIVGAEAFTAGDQERWQQHPATLKSLGDEAFCVGINRFVFHRYAMQPWLDYRPGMTMGPWGVHYERTQTWWDWTPTWHQYLARCQWLLRQGLFVADICYLQDETSPQGFASHPSNGYGWDECPAEVVLTRMNVRDGRLVLPDGMSYRLLVLPPTRSMTPQLLSKIKQLATDGATIVGPPPVSSPSLTDYPQCDAQVRETSAELWGPCDGHQIMEHRCGEGRVVWGPSPETVLARQGVPADFLSGGRLQYIHRATSEADMYFVANNRPQRVTTTAAFRVTGKVPELWWPDSGQTELAGSWQEKDGTTRVALSLEPSGSVFVVFRKPASACDPIVACSHDGHVLWSASDSIPPRIEVLRAAYGIEGDLSRSRDVRERVQRKVDEGERSFQVSQMATGDDPAHGAVKTLMVEYRIGEKTYTVKARDPDTIHLTDEVVKITVTQARYGILDDPQRTRDVRALVQRIADAGHSRFPVARLAAEDDPAYLVVKTLVLEYLLDGKTYSIRATDPETLDLLPLEPESDAIAQLHYDAEAGNYLEVTRPGLYECRTASGQVITLEVPTWRDASELSGPWLVEFNPAWGGPALATFDQLTDWSQHDDAGIRYYSGEAVYRKTFQFDPTESPRDRCVLDLGQVNVMADVTLNGNHLGVLWKPPYRVDATDSLRAGDNVLEVRIVNLWINRLIGDEQLEEDSARYANGTLKQWPEWVEQLRPSPTGRFTFTTWRLWKRDEPLHPSGLSGPVRLIPVQRWAVP